MENANMAVSAVRQLNEAVSSASGKLSSEISGGRWDDPVGRSYDSALSSFKYSCDQINQEAEKLIRIESSLLSIDENRDKTQIADLERELNRL